MDDLVKWLRKQIEDERSTAQLVGAGGFVAERWDTDPPGQVNPVAEPGSAVISHAIGQELDYTCGWVRIVAWTRLNSEPPEADCQDPGVIAALAENGRRQFDHIIRHDPRSVVAGCEAKLAILDEHYILRSDDASEAWEELSVYRIGPAGVDFGCVTCHYYAQGAVKSLGYCRTVRHLASAYRFRPGYDERWAPETR